MSGVAAFNVRAVLSGCRDMETAMADLYDLLAKIHAGVPYMAKLWSKTANEERNHAAQFTLALDIANGAVKAVRVDISTIERTVHAVHLLREEYLARPPTVEQALQAAITSEEALVDLHADKIPIFAEESHKRLFVAMMAADREHVGRLRRALAVGPSTPTPTPVPLYRSLRK
jgi:rubrerythrin